MEYNSLSIALTTVGLYFVSLLLITIFTFVHLGCAKTECEVKATKVFIATSLISLGWIAATFISLIVAKNIGVLVFSALAFLMIFGATYFIGKKTLPLKGKSLLIYSLIVAIVFNPGWLSLFKVL